MMEPRTVVVNLSVFQAALGIQQIAFDGVYDGQPFSMTYSMDGREPVRYTLLHIGRAIDTICNPENPAEGYLLALLKEFQPYYTHMLVIWDPDEEYDWEDEV